MTSHQQTTWIFSTRGRVGEGPRRLESCLSSPPPRQREKKPRAKVGAEDSNTSYISWHGGAHITLPSQIKISVTELSRWVSPSSPRPPPLFLYRTRKIGRSNFCLLSWLRRVTENMLFKGAVSIWLSESAGFMCRPLKPAPEARHSHPIRGKSTRELSHNDGHECEARLSYTAKYI